MATVVHCFTEFIQLLASECNEVSTKDKKNTITPDHVIKALEELGFSEFTDEVKGALQQFKDETKSELSGVGRRALHGVRVEADV